MTKLNYIKGYARRIGILSLLMIYCAFVFYMFCMICTGVKNLRPKHRIVKYEFKTELGKEYVI